MSLRLITNIAAKNRPTVLSTCAVGNAPDESVGMCLPASQQLLPYYIREGYTSHLVRGRFGIDNPNPEMYGDDTPEGMMYNPLHFWLEVQDTDKRWYIVDITADQFNDEMDEDAPPVLVIPIGESGRHQPLLE